MAWIHRWTIPQSFRSSYQKRYSYIRRYIVRRQTKRVSFPVDWLQRAISETIHRTTNEQTL